MLDPRRLLGNSSFYQFAQGVMGGRARQEYVERYIRPEPGMRILDVGCGPGDVLRFLPASVDYTGVDLSAEYISSARKAFGDRGRFLNEAVGDLTVREPHSFDRVMANGLIHHLDDADARKLLAVAKAALKPGGWFVSIDGCFESGQSRLARFFLRRDRGQFVRQRDEYLALAREVFPDLEHEVRHDLMRIPYTHLILRCPAGADT